MHDPQQNLDDDWAGLEPERSQSGSQMMLYAGIGIAALFGLVVCGVAAYFVWAQSSDRTTADDVPAIALPTSIVEETAVSA